MAKKLISYDDEAEGLGLPDVVEEGLNATYGTKADVQAVVEDVAGVQAEIEGRLGVRTENRDLAIAAGSSTMSRLALHFLTPDLADLGITLSQRYTAQGGWKASHISASLGTRPLAVDATTIPSTGSVTITPLNMDEAGVTSSYLQWLGSLAGVHGTLTKAAGTDTWVFVRDQPGDPVPVVAETPFVPSVPITHRNALAIINYGKNSINLTTPGWDVPRLEDLTESAVNRFGGADGRVLVMGHFIDTNTPAVSAVRTRIEEYNTRMAQRYGDRFFDLAGYVTGEQAWLDTGIAPTQTDLDQQALGNMPPSLALNDAHLNDTSYAALSKRIIGHLSWLRWVTPLPPSWSTVALDDFNRADGVLAGQSTAVGGKTWQEMSPRPSVSIVNNEVARTGGGSQIAVLDPGSNDQRVTAKLAALGATPADRTIRLIARAQSHEVYYFITTRANHSMHGVSIWRAADGGGFFSLAATTEVIPEVGDTLTLEVAGSTLVGYRNGVEILRTTDTTLASGKAGILLMDDYGVVDDFKMEVRG